MAENEDRDELFALAEKATLYQKTAYRFTHLEALLSAHLHLATYSKDEIADLLSEFQSLSEQDQQTIISNVTSKTSPGYFHLLPDEVDRIKAGRKRLSLHERARLSSAIDAWAGVAWLDLGGVMDARVELDDHSSAERKKRPYVRIYHPNDPAREIDTINGPHVETIDILESVRNDAAAVGHPAIAFAIYHWQRVAQAKRVFERDNVYIAQNETRKRIKYLFGGEKDVEIAERNLKAIGDALLEPKKNAISKEFALFVNAEALGLEDEKSLLRIAWDNLKLGRSDHRLKRKNEPDLLKSVESCLREAGHSQPSGSLSVEKVMDFLKADEGKRFIGNDEDGNSLRPKWVIFKNAFIGWHFTLKPEVVQQYLERARKESIDPKIIYRPSYGKPRTDIFQFLTYILRKPLFAAQEPTHPYEDEVAATNIEESLAVSTLASTAKRA